MRYQESPEDSVLISITIEECEDLAAIKAWLCIEGYQTYKEGNSELLYLIEASRMSEFKESFMNYTYVPHETDNDKLTEIIRKMIREYVYLDTSLPQIEEDVDASTDFDELTSLLTIMSYMRGQRSILLKYLNELKDERGK